MSIQSPNVIGFPSKFKHVGSATGGWVMRAEGGAAPISLFFPIVDVSRGGGVKNHANVSTWIKNSTAPRLLAKIF